MSKSTLTLKQLQTLGKEKKIKGWHKMKSAELHEALVTSLGIEKEKKEVQDFIIQGGQIQEVKSGPFPAPKPQKQDSALVKRDREGNVKTKKPRKSSKFAEGENGEWKAKPRTQKFESVTLQDICEEIGVVERVARRRLRNSDFKKMGTQWQWKPEDPVIQEVKDFLSSPTKKVAEEKTVEAKKPRKVKKAPVKEVKKPARKPVKKSTKGSR